MLFDLSQHGDQPHAEELPERQRGKFREQVRRPNGPGFLHNQKKRDRKEDKVNIMHFESGLKYEHIQEYPKVAL